MAKSLATFNLDLNDYPLAQTISNVLKEHTSEMVRVVFQVEAHPDHSLLPIEDRAAQTELSVEDYATVLSQIKKHPLVQRALFFQRIRNFADEKLWADLMLVRQWAIDSQNGKLLKDILKELQESALRLAEIDNLTLKGDIGYISPIDSAGQRPMTIKPVSARNLNGKSKRD